MSVKNSSRFNLKEGTDWGISKFLENYQGDVINTMTRVCEEVAREATQRLKSVSPKETGKYKKGWTYKVDKGRIKVGATIYGKDPTYRLAHLLEYGHALKSGGRKIGDVKAIEHIRPVNDWANDEVVNRTIERLNSL